MADADAPPTQRCPRCGASFACGIASERCWCAQLPPLPALPVHAQPSCLCPACLRELTLRERPADREQDGPRR
ncbi:MAG: cysteine-rich CWC family protein [Burkholderiaceae bacterium]